MKAAVGAQTAPSTSVSWPLSPRLEQEVMYNIPAHAGVTPTSSAPGPHTAVTSATGSNLEIRRLINGGTRCEALTTFPSDRQRGVAHISATSNGKALAEPVPSKVSTVVCSA